MAICFDWREKKSNLNSYIKERLALFTIGLIIWRVTIRCGKASSALGGFSQRAVFHSHSRTFRTGRFFICLCYLNCWIIKKHFTDASENDYQYQWKKLSEVYFRDIIVQVIFLVYGTQNKTWNRRHKIKLKIRDTK